MLVSSTGLLNLSVASVVSLDWACIREAMPQLCDHPTKLVLRRSLHRPFAVVKLGCCPVKSLGQVLLFVPLVISLLNLIESMHNVSTRKGCIVHM